MDTYRNPSGHPRKTKRISDRMKRIPKRTSAGGNPSGHGIECRMDKERRRELDRLRKAKKRASDPAYYAAELSRNRIRARLRYVPRVRKGAKTQERMLGKCAICPHVCKGKTKLDVLHFDHCHKTNRHRGWLCRSCNLLLGYAKDSPEVLLAAIRYLEYNRNSTPSE